MPLFSSLLLSDIQYIPHGHCYLWQTPLVGLHVTADALIAISYYLIPIFLLYFVRQVEELPFKSVFILFTAFILSCGTTHIAEIWTLWHPDYWISGILKAITALISLYAAFSLIPILPILINLPSPKYLEKLNRQLNEKIVSEEKIRQELVEVNHNLEERVEQKTSALIEVNNELQRSINFRKKITELLPNLLYIYDLDTNSNVFCNPFVYELLGYSAQAVQQFENSLLGELVHPDDVENVVHHQNKCLALNGDEYLEIEYRIRDINGEWYWLQDRNIIFTRDTDSRPKQILGVALDVTQAKKAQVKADILNQQLNEKIALLEIKDRSRVRLSQMNRLIQACGNLDEAKLIVADLLQPLFPNTSGAVYLMKNSNDVVDTLSTWNGVQSETHFHSRSCWGLRLGSSYLVYAHAPKLYCSHVSANAELRPTLCVPMIAEGTAIGVLHLQFHNCLEIDLSTQNLAETVAQNLALAFTNLKLQQELRYQSLNDTLTGLYNRRYLEEALKQELDRAHRQQQFISIIMLDIDYFKRFNDIHGHNAGDLVLKKVGAFLLSHIREYDVACRYGGEELIIIMPDAAIEDAIIRAETIREGIKNLQLRHEGKKLEAISISIGVSCFPDDGIKPDALIDAADKALYEAKKQGRDCVRRC